MLAYTSGSHINLLLFVITSFTFALKTFALVDVVLRRPEAFVATGKLNKLAWFLILVLAFLFGLLPVSPLNLVNLAGDVGAIVYLVDVRPAIRGLGGTAGSLMFFGRGSGGPRRPRGGGSSGW